MKTYTKRFIEQHGYNFAIILTVGLAIRFLFDLFLTDSPLLGDYSADSLVLHSWANQIIAGTDSSLPFFRAPLYAYLLASVYYLFGDSHWSAIILNHILGLSTLVVIYLFALKLANRKIALWSALLAAVYPVLIFYEGETLITTLAVFLFTLSVYRMYLAYEIPKTSYVIAAGIIIGLAGITRPTFLPLALVFPLMHLLFCESVAIKKRLANIILFVLAVFIPILPVAARNYIVSGEAVLISTQGGVNFYIGNGPEADGITVRAPGPNLRIGDHNDNIWSSSVDEAEQRLGESLTQKEVSDFWYSEAFNYILDNPVSTAKLIATKLYLFWHGYEIFNNRPLYDPGYFNPVTHFFVWSHWLNFPAGLLFPLGFLGFIIALRRDRSALIPIGSILLFAVLVSLFFVCSRFRLPIIPIISIFTVIGIVEIIEAFRGSMIRFISTLGMSILLIVVLNAGGNIDSKENRSQSKVLVGTSLLNKGFYHSGTEYLKESLQHMESNTPVYDMLGQTYMAQGKLQDARSIYSDGLKIDSTYLPFHLGLARVHLQGKEYEKALRSYRKVLKQGVNTEFVYWEIGAVFEATSEHDSALHYYELLDSQPEVTGENKRQLQAKIYNLRTILE